MALASKVLGSSIVGIFCVLALHAFTYVLVIKRLHDMNMSGWWVCVPFLALICFFVKGTEGKNAYGEPQKEGVSLWDAVWIYE